MSQQLKKVTVLGVPFLVPTTVGQRSVDVLRYIAENSYLPDGPPRPSNHHLAPFDRTSPLSLSPAPNGGFTVYARGEKGYVMDQTLGAFSNATDMLSALTSALKETV